MVDPVERTRSRATSHTPWRQCRRETGRTGHVAESSVNTEPEAHWSFDTGYFEVSAEPIVDRNVTYIGGSNGLHAVDDVGSEVWTFETDQPVSTSPAVETDSVYVSCIDDHVYALEVASGEKQWETEIEGGHSSPAVVDGTVYVGSDDYGVYALNGETGDVEWRLETDGMVRSSPAVADGTVFVGSDDGVLYAIDTETGETEWEADRSDVKRIGTAVAVADGTVFTGCGRTIRAFDAETGEQRWKFAPEPPELVSSPAVADGTVVFGCANTGLYALEAATGEKRWVFAGNDAMGAPLIADRTAVVGSHDGNLYGVDVDGGEKLWTVGIGEAVTGGPSLIDGVVYVGCGDGTVRSFRGDSADTAATEFGSNEHVDAPTVAEQRETNEWPVSGGDPGRTSHLEGTGPTAAAVYRWEFSTGYKLYEGLATDGDRIYVGDENYDAVRAFDAEDGSECWTADTARPVDTDPVVADGTVYVGCRDSVLYAISAEDGERRWTADVDGRMAAPVIAGETAYLNAESTLYALEVATGDPCWSVDLDGVADGSPVLAYGTLYVSGAGTLYALDPATGTERWHADVGETATAPAIGELHVYVGGDDTQYAIDAETGETAWRAGFADTLETPAVSDGIVYVGSAEGTLAALEADTGEKRWTVEARGDVSAPAVDGETVYIGSGDENLYAVDADTGDERFFLEVDGPTGQPVIADGAVFVVTDHREVLALDPHGVDATAPEVAEPEEWALVGGDLGRTNHAGGGGPTGEVDLRWRTELDRHPNGDAVVEGGTVYVASDQNTVDAYDVATGEKRWSVDVGRPVMSTPVVADDTVYAGTNGGTLFALEATTGQGRWSYEATASGFSHFTASPAVSADGETVLVPSTDGHLYAIDADTGDERWAFDAGNDLECAPIVAGRTVYVGGYDVYAIDVETGTKQWSYTPESKQVTGIAYADGTLFIGTTGGVLAAVDTDRGTEMWTVRTERTVSPPAVDVETVYAVSGGTVYAVDAETGSERWQYDLGTRSTAAPAVADDVVYVGDASGTLRAIDDGEKQWTIDLDDRVTITSSPTVANGSVYVLDQSGSLSAIGEPGQEPESGADAGDENETTGEPETNTAIATAVDVTTRDDVGEFLSSAADDTPNPTDEQLQEAILGTLCDEWQDVDRNVRLSLEEITDRVARVLPGGSEGLVRHNVQRLDEEAFVGFERAYETVSLRARGVAKYQQLSDRKVVPDTQLMEVLEPLYERSRHSPRTPHVSREELLKETYLDEDELDRTIWFLKDVGLSLGGIYLDAGGYIDVHTQRSQPWWLSAQINRFGKQLYEELS